MGKIYYMMGKSSSGKDTIYKDIRKDLPELKTLTLYTTRPMREGEKDGVEYYFVTDEILEKYREEGKIIELRRSTRCRSCPSPYPGVVSSLVRGMRYFSGKHILIGRS